MSVQRGCNTSRHTPSEILENLQEILNNMQVTKRTANRVQLENVTHKAAVRLTWNKQEKTWLLTAFEKKEASAPIDKTTDTDDNPLDLRGDTALSQSTNASVDKDTTIQPKYKQNKYANSLERGCFWVAYQCAHISLFSVITNYLSPIMSKCDAKVYASGISASLWRFPGTKCPFGERWGEEGKSKINPANVQFRACRCCIVYIARGNLWYLCLVGWSGGKIKGGAQRHPFTNNRLIFVNYTSSPFVA